MIDWQITVETLPPRPWRVGGYAIDDTWSVFDANERIICRGIMTKPTADFIAWCGNNFRTVTTAADLESLT
jgi:hypothetical protein